MVLWRALHGAVEVNFWIHMSQECSFLGSVEINSEKCVYESIVIIVIYLLHST